MLKRCTAAAHDGNRMSLSGSQAISAVCGERQFNQSGLGRRVLTPDDLQGFLELRKPPVKATRLPTRATVLKAGSSPPRSLMKSWRLRTVTMASTRFLVLSDGRGDFRLLHCGCFLGHFRSS